MNDFYEDEIVSALINKFPLIKKDTLQIQCIFSKNCELKRIKKIIINKTNNVLKFQRLVVSLIFIFFQI
jgi:hypothetical protein